MEIVITGRKPDPDIIAAADCVTETIRHEHPYREGAPARKGIEHRR